MLKTPFLSKNWVDSTTNFNKAACVMVGLPYDGTCSYRPGAGFAPELIRLASWGLESFSPHQNKHLASVKFYDAGEIEFQPGNREDTIKKIEVAATEVLDSGKKWLGIGGEHLVTYPTIKAYIKKYPQLAVIHFDAHADLREEYLGEELSHACVMKRVVELIGPKNLIQIGIRSGTQEEYAWIRKNKSLIQNHSDLAKKIKLLKNRPIFISIDLDVLDPSIMSGTGTPEPGGMSYPEFIEYLMLLKNLNIVGADVVELSPPYDASGVSTITAAKVIREVLLLMKL